LGCCVTLRFVVTLTLFCFCNGAPFDVEWGWGRSPALKILQIRWVQDVGQELPWCCRVEYPQFDAMGRCSARWTIIDTSALLVQDIDVVLGQGPCADPHFFIE
jgi:hypothetical protein